MKISEKTWHVRLNRWLDNKRCLNPRTGHCDGLRTICQYFWHTVFNIIAAAFVVTAGKINDSVVSRFLNRVTEVDVSGTTYLLRVCHSRTTLCCSLTLCMIAPYFATAVLSAMAFVLGWALWQFFHWEGCWFFIGMTLGILLASAAVGFLSVQIRKARDDRKTLLMHEAYQIARKENMDMYDAFKVAEERRIGRRESGFLNIAFQFVKAVKNRACPMIEFYNPDKEIEGDATDENA